MKIEIRQENYKQLAQCVYLGNLIINEYRKDGESEKEYSDFVEDVLMQIAKSLPKQQTNFKFKNFPNEKSDSILLGDLIDRIEDSVKEFYEQYRRSLFCEMFEELFIRGGQNERVN